MPAPNNIETIAAQVRAALGEPNLSAFADLLDPNVQWGAPDDRGSGCHNRSQVLDWYQRGREAGVRAEVSEVTVLDNRLLVGLAVTGTPAAEQAGGSVERWQILTVRDGRVVDIVAFDRRDQAVHWTTDAA